MLPRPMQSPAAPAGQGPVSSVFRNMAAHQMAPAMGHSPSPMQMPGAPKPLNPGGKPQSTAGHMPPFLPR